MKTLVTGGRGYANRDEVFSVLDQLNERFGVSLLIHGAATGADSLANDWATERGIAIKEFPVTKDDWRTLGKKAGPLRNAKMIEEQPNVVVAFPGGRGTADMVSKARAANIVIVEICQ